MEKTMKWSPFFSSLLQSRAALLQANNPQSKNEVMPLLQSNFLLGPSQDHPTAIAAQNSADQMPSSTPLPLPSAASSVAQANITAPPAQTQSFSNELVAPAQITATPHPPTSQEGASSTPSTPTSNSVKSAQPPNHITLPLIRSKTGRIILPSSLKPSKLTPPPLFFQTLNSEFSPHKILRGHSKVRSLIIYSSTPSVFLQVYFLLVSHSLPELLSNHGHDKRRGW